MIFSGRRLRRDYDDELRKAKAAISDQAQHFETFKKEVRANEEKSAGRLKRLTEEYNSKVSRTSLFFPDQKKAVSVKRVLLGDPMQRIVEAEDSGARSG